MFHCTRPKRSSAFDRSTFKAKLKVRQALVDEDKSMFIHASVQGVRGIQVGIKVLC